MMRRTIPRKLVLLKMKDGRYYSTDAIAELLYDDARVHSLWNAYHILRRMQNHGAVRYIKAHDSWKITGAGRRFLR